jgi:hypothetical protein
MQTVELESLLQGFIGACKTLEKETSKFLANMQTSGDAELEAFNTLRQNLMADIQKFDRELRLRLNDAESPHSAVIANLLKNFAGRHKSHTLRILELDAAIVSAVNEKLELVRSELTTLGRGRHALNGYGTAAFVPKIVLDQKA